MFGIAIICALVGTVLQLLGPDKLSDIAAYIEAGLMTGNVDLDAIFKIGVTLICFYAASWLLSSAQHWIMATITQRVSKPCAGIFPTRSNACPCGITTATPPAMCSPA